MIEVNLNKKKQAKFPITPLEFFIYCAIACIVGVILAISFEVLL